MEEEQIPLRHYHSRTRRFILEIPLVTLSVSFTRSVSRVNLLLVSLSNYEYILLLTFYLSDLSILTLKLSWSEQSVL